MSWVNTGLALLVLSLGWVSFPMARILTNELMGRSEPERVASDDDPLAGKNRKLARVTIASPNQHDLRFASPGLILPPLPEEPLANYIGAQAPVVTIADAAGANESEGRRSQPDSEARYVPSLVPGRGAVARIAEHASGFTGGAGGGGIGAPGASFQPAVAREDSADHSAADAVTGAASKDEASPASHGSRGDSPSTGPSAASATQARGGAAGDKAPFTASSDTSASNASPAPKAIEAAAAALASPPAVVEAATAAASELVSAENGIVSALADPDVPEPPMLVLTGFGLAFLAYRLRRRQQIG